MLPTIRTKSNDVYAIGRTADEMNGNVSRQRSKQYQTKTTGSKYFTSN
jgi:hypothetical protein